MKRLLLSFLCFGILAVAAQAAEPPGAQTLVRPTDVSAPLRSGIDMGQIEPKVRPQDDLSGYVNGKWFATTEIPPDKAAYSAGSKIYDDTQLQLRGIVEKESAQAHPKSGAPQRIGDLYRSFMDEARLEALGTKPLAAEFARIEAIKSKRDVAATIGHLAPDRRQCAVCSAGAPGQQGLDPLHRRSRAGGSRLARPRLLSAWTATPS